MQMNDVQHMLTKRIKALKRKEKHSVDRISSLDETKDDHMSDDNADDEETDQNELCKDDDVKNYEVEQGWAEISDTEDDSPVVTMTNRDDHPEHIQLAKGITKRTDDCGSDDNASDDDRNTVCTDGANSICGKVSFLKQTDRLISDTYHEQRRFTEGT